ncbi:Flp pilus assembly protein TadG [Formivibrio citricus]|uniref:Flp pilus assembly protein TadG n=1 Tax=Formivibrio citricus TaxID=83765 RepID=A0A1I4WZN6_9NEIS|nr:TadE/TadG family type IV pilus assembly protein [Formivibrio citricus]SFN18693.1 Flp pilus assembly protein TadG [Formivibrio citricus]
MGTQHMVSIKRREHGAAAIEFALLIVFLLIIVTGLIEFGKTFWYYDALVKSTRDAARFLTDSRTTPPLAPSEGGRIALAKQIVVNAASAANIPDFNTGHVAVECDPDCAAPNYVTVRINAYPVTIGGWVPVFTPNGTTSWTGSLSPYTTMRYMR